jgi:large subunit ribosomal protein L10
MNRDQKAALVDELASEISGAEAIFAVDYRGISVPQAAELRSQLRDAGATFRVVKNRLTLRAIDAAGVTELKDVLEGPTAFTFVRGDAVLAAKALSKFRREHEILEFKGGLMEGAALDAGQFESIAKLPGRDILNGQLAGIVASPLTGLVRGLASMISGLAIQLQQIQEQGLVGGSAEPVAEETTQEAAEETEEQPEETPETPEETPAEETPEEETPEEETPETPEETSEESEKEE